MYSVEGAPSQHPPGGQSERCFGPSSCLLAAERTDFKKEDHFLESDRNQKIISWGSEEGTATTSYGDGRCVWERNSTFAVMFIQEEIQQPRREREETEEEDSVITHPFSTQTICRSLLRQSKQQKPCANKWLLLFQGTHRQSPLADRGLPLLGRSFWSFIPPPEFRLSSFSGRGQIIASIYL